MSTTHAAQLALAPEALLDDIEPNPLNIRHTLGDLTELAASITAEGVIEPVVVYRNPDVDGPTWMLIAGHRRLAASRIAGLETVPYNEVAVPTEAELIAKMLIENLHRSDLSPIDEAMALLKMSKNGPKKLTLKQLAAAVGRGQQWVAERLALLKLPEMAYDLVRDGSLPIGDAVQIAQAKGLTEAQRIELIGMGGTQRRWKLEDMIKDAARNKLLGEFSKAWPGRPIVSENPNRQNSQFAERIQLAPARYGDQPGEINLPPEMGDADHQVLVVPSWGPVPDRPIVWLLNPETLTLADFVPFSMVADLDEDVAVWPEIPDGTKRAMFTESPGVQSHEREYIHRSCPHHVEVFVPWSNHTLSCCSNPAAHDDGGDLPWSRLVELHKENGPKLNPVKRLTTDERLAERFGTEFVDRLNSMLDELLAPIPDAVLNILGEVGEYSSAWLVSAPNDDVREIEFDRAQLMLTMREVLWGRVERIDDLGPQTAWRKIIDGDQYSSFDMEAILTGGWVASLPEQFGLNPDERLAAAFADPDPVEVFFAAMNDALDAGETVWGCDHDAMHELGQALAEAGWTVDCDDDDRIDITAEDGRSFTMHPGVNPDTPTDDDEEGDDDAEME